MPLPSEPINVEESFQQYVARRLSETEKELSELHEETAALRKFAVGQTAMITLLSTLLASNGALTPQEGMLVAMAGRDAQEQKGLTPGQIEDWARRQYSGTQKKPSGG